MKYSHLVDSAVVKKVSEKNNIGIFHIEGLYTGYGMTLGNAIRRALLSSLPGAAITQVKIKNASHEFTTIPGMKEDVLELCLNLKKVRFHFFADEPQTLTLNIKGDHEVKAGDIKSTTLVQVINTDLHLATLTAKNAELSLEFTVEKGLGYVQTETRKHERISVGTIMLDAIFTPIVKVSFDVENMRVGDRTDFNKLILEIITDGSISPSEALHKAGNILKDHFDKVSGIEFESTQKEEEKEEVKEEEPQEKTTKKKKK